MDGDDATKIRSALSVSPIADSREQRQSVERALEALLSQEIRLDDPVAAFNTTRLYYAYQDCNVREFQENVALVYARASPQLNYVAPHCLRSQPVSRNRRIRIGFISQHFLLHSHAKLISGIINNLSTDNFHIFVLRFSDRLERLARAIKTLRIPSHLAWLERIVQPTAGEVIDLPHDLCTARELISRLELDVLFYVELGSFSITYFLAFGRLAPIQCVTWGIPFTSGLRTIDYFLSSVDAEPEDAENHYTERLVRLKRLPTYYYKPAPCSPPKPRSDFRLDPGERVYLCPQSLFKLHPDFDDLFARILRAEPRVRVVLVSSEKPDWADALMGRLSRAIPDFRNRIQFAPRQQTDDFLHLIGEADVLLDPIYFGGGNTTYEALSVGTPIVTLPGRFMRGRVTYACYRKMSVMDCVAKDRDDYVQLAVTLATDRALGEAVRAKILAANQVLYEDSEAVREIERFLTRAVETERERRISGASRARIRVGGEDE